MYEYEFERSDKFAATATYNGDSDPVRLSISWQNKKTGETTSSDSETAPKGSIKAEELSATYQRWQAWYKSRETQIDQWNNQAAQHAAETNLLNLPDATPAEKAQAATKAKRAVKKAAAKAKQKAKTTPGKPSDHKGSGLKTLLIVGVVGLGLWWFLRK